MQGSRAPGSLFCPVPERIRAARAEHNEADPCGSGFTAFSFIHSFIGLRDNLTATLHRAAPEPPPPVCLSLCLSVCLSVFHLSPPPLSNVLWWQFHPNKSQKTPEQVEPVVVRVSKRACDSLKCNLGFMLLQMWPLDRCCQMGNVCLKGWFTPEKWKFPHYLLTTLQMEMVGEVSESTKHFWSFRATQRCSQILYNWIKWFLKCKLQRVKAKTTTKRTFRTLRNSSLPTSLTQLKSFNLSAWMFCTQQTCEHKDLSSSRTSSQHCCYLVLLVTSHFFWTFFQDTHTHTLFSWSDSPKIQIMGVAVWKPESPTQGEQIASYNHIMKGFQADGGAVSSLTPLMTGLGTLREQRPSFIVHKRPYSHTFNNTDTLYTHHGSVRMFGRHGSLIAVRCCQGNLWRFDVACDKTEFFIYFSNHCHLCKSASPRIIYCGWPVHEPAQYPEHMNSRSLSSKEHVRTWISKYCVFYEILYLQFWYSLSQLIFSNPRRAQVFTSLYFTLFLVYVKSHPLLIHWPTSTLMSQVHLISYLLTHNLWTPTLTAAEDRTLQPEQKTLTWICQNGFILQLLLIWLAYNHW